MKCLKELDWKIMEVKKLQILPWSGFFLPSLQNSFGLRQSSKLSSLKTPTTFDLDSDQANSKLEGFCIIAPQ